MPDFPPTDEQTTVINAYLANRDHLMIDALAGAAKTTTLVFLAEANPMERILNIAFNKSIADELASRLPPNCTARTLHSIGFAAWRSRLRSRNLSCKVDKSKTYRLVREAVLASLGDTEGADLRAARLNEISNLMKLVGLAKNTGALPREAFPSARPVMDLSEFLDAYEENLEKWEEEVLSTVLVKSTKEGLYGGATGEAIVDFDDMVFLPTIFRAEFPFYSTIMVDEAQDLSPLNHRLIELMTTPRTRLIAVGDPCQAIYAFRGADSLSMEKLREKFSMTTYTLSTTFRCPTSVVAEAQWRAPHLRAAPWAKEGQIDYPEAWSASDIPDGAAILCRNNAPLFRTAMRLMRAGRRPNIVGRDFGKSIIKDMNDLGAGDMPKESAINALETWAIKKAKRLKNKQALGDRVACMRLFIEVEPTLGEAIERANLVFQQEGNITLSTGHKSKGLEFSNVYILDRDLLRLDEPQDANLLYVMQTRAKENLTYIYSNDFIE